MCECYPAELPHPHAALSLSACEDFIEFCNSESFKAYTYIFIHPMQLSTYLYVRACVCTCIYHVCIDLSSQLSNICQSLSPVRCYTIQRPRASRFQVPESLNEFRKTLLTRDRPFSRSLPTEDHTNTEHSNTHNGTPTHDSVLQRQNTAGSLGCRTTTDGGRPMLSSLLFGLSGPTLPIAPVAAYQTVR
jgi:hypothetical protein